MITTPGCRSWIRCAMSTPEGPSPNSRSTSTMSGSKATRASRALATEWAAATSNPFCSSTSHSRRVMRGSSSTSSRRRSHWRSIGKTLRQRRLQTPGQWCFHHLADGRPERVWHVPAVPRRGVVPADTFGRRSREEAHGHGDDGHPCCWVKRKRDCRKRCRLALLQQHGQGWPRAGGWQQPGRQLCQRLPEHSGHRGGWLRGVRGGEGKQHQRRQDALEG